MEGKTSVYLENLISLPAGYVEHVDWAMTAEEILYRRRKVRKHSRKRIGKPTTPTKRDRKDVRNDGGWDRLNVIQDKDL